MPIGQRDLGQGDHGLGTNRQVPIDIVTQGLWLLGFTLAFHVVLRWRAEYADPLILPTAFLLPAAIEGKPAWVNNPFYGCRFFPPELARRTDAAAPFKKNAPKADTG